MKLDFLNSGNVNNPRIKDSFGPMRLPFLGTKNANFDGMQRSAVFSTSNSLFNIHLAPLAAVNFIFPNQFDGFLD